MKIKTLLIIFFNLLIQTNGCSIFKRLNCSCFQSNNDLNVTLPVQTYSHLFCKGSSLDNKTFELSSNSHLTYYNRFQTVTFEFTTNDKIEIQSNQFEFLSLLFSQTKTDGSIDIYLRFNGFENIQFHKYSLTSSILKSKHRNKRLWIYLMPKMQKVEQIESNDENLSNTGEKINFDSDCFHGLIVSQLTFHIYTVHNGFIMTNTFEQIFNNTNIGELHFHGTIIQPDPYALKESFKGLIRSLTVYRHGDIIDSYNFPYFSQVNSYKIHSTEANGMNLATFLYYHKNLRAIEIIKPRFEIIIDQYIPTLDSLTLDVENLNEYTLFAARDVRNLKLGTRLRSIDNRIYEYFLKDLTYFDLSDIDLSQMIGESRCNLIEYLSNNNEKTLNIIYPKKKNLTECDCSQIYLEHIQSRGKLNTNDGKTCSRSCRFSECQIVSDYFKMKHPVFDDDDTDDDDEMLIQKENSTNLHQYLPIVNVFSGLIDIDPMSSVNSAHNIGTTKKRRTTTTTTTTTEATPETHFVDIHINDILTAENISESNNVITFFTPIIIEPLTEKIDTDTTQSPELKSTKFSWLLFIVCLALLILLLIIIFLIIYLVFNQQKQHHAKSGPVYL